MSDHLAEERKMVIAALNDGCAPERIRVHMVWPDNIGDLRSVSIDPLGRLWTHARDENGDLYLVRVRMDTPR